jgi:hypothetical protein
MANLPFINHPMEWWLIICAIFSPSFPFLVRDFGTEERGELAGGKRPEAKRSAHHPFFAFYALNSATIWKGAPGGE